jgi:hypothetical protein
MTKTTVLLTLIITALSNMPADAQQVRAFVSGNGLDTNPCTLSQPCRTFQQAFNTIPANGTIWVLDPAGYQPLTITHGVTIQGGGMGAITAASGTAITVLLNTSDPVTLNGLVLDGLGTGNTGINIASGPSVQILNSIIRRFQSGIAFGTASGGNLLIEDTVVSDNLSTGIVVGLGAINAQATLNRITANNNVVGVANQGTTTTIANSVISNNSTGLVIQPQITSITTWLSKTVISGNAIGVKVEAGTVNSYGDNYIRDNGTPVMGTLTPVTTQ